MRIYKEKKLLKGFTLVELVIVIAIVIVLSVVSVPIYRSYVDKAKMSEGYALAGTLVSAQKAYYSEYGNFLNYTHSHDSGTIYTDYSPVLGVDARGNKYFTWFEPGNLSNTSYYFHSLLHGPAEIFKNGNSGLILQYNLTKGTKISDYPSGFDHSWSN